MLFTLDTVQYQCHPEGAPVPHREDQDMKAGKASRKQLCVAHAHREATKVPQPLLVFLGLVGQLWGEENVG